MEWLERMNDALAYMENNLDSKISIEKAAQIACCSQYHFQRMFSYVIGVPLSEYLRRRRLTMAAFDLQGGDKVIDVALRYGYDSPTAFNRAFHTIHGISPSAAQKPNATLKAFGPVSFQISITGATEMEFRIQEKEAFRVVGIRMKIGDNPIENGENIMTFWENVSKNGLLRPILQLIDGNHTPANLLGLYVGDDGDGSGHYHICAATDKPTPDGMFAVNVPKHTWAIFSGSGKPTGIVDLLRRIYAEWQPAANYDFAANIDMEVYADMTPDDMKYEIWMPVVKKS